MLSSIEENLKSLNVVNISKIPAYFPKLLKPLEFIDFNENSPDLSLSFSEVFIDYVVLEEWVLTLDEILANEFDTDFLSWQMTSMYESWKNSACLDYLKDKFSKDLQICFCPFWAYKFSVDTWDSLHLFLCAYKCDTIEKLSLVKKLDFVFDILV